VTTFRQDDYDIYMDESGDLGFGNGSSRCFVITALMVQAPNSVRLKRFVRRFKAKNGLSTQVELKASRMQCTLRNEFCRGLACLPCTVHYIVINKQNVKPELRRDTNILYNYVAGLLLVPMMSPVLYATVNLDRRTIKVTSGNSLSDYLRVKLWYEERSIVQVSFKYLDSKQSLGIQAADIACNAVFRSYERYDTSDLDVLVRRVKDRRELFF
jgi:hypothetical protein